MGLGFFYWKNFDRLLSNLSAIFKDILNNKYKFDDEKHERKKLEWIRSLGVNFLKLRIEIIALKSNFIDFLI